MKINNEAKQAEQAEQTNNVLLFRRPTSSSKQNAEEEYNLSFEEVMKKNNDISDKLKRARNRSNEKVLRSYKIKKR